MSANVIYFHGNEKDERPFFYLCFENFQDETTRDNCHRWRLTSNHLLSGQTSTLKDKTATCMNVISHIKRGLVRGYFRIGATIHVRHWRGRGIHSPFMYAIVRSVFMQKRIIGRDQTLYNALIQHGIGRRSGIILQNLYTHCKMERFVLVGETDTPLPLGPVFCVLLPDTSAETVALMARHVLEQSGYLVVLAPHRSPHRWRVTQQIRWRHRCVSVDRKVMMLYFADPKLQPQHYRI